MGGITLLKACLGKSLPRIIAQNLVTEEEKCTSTFYSGHGKICLVGLPLLVTFMTIFFLILFVQLHKN